MVHDDGGLMMVDDGYNMFWLVLRNIINMFIYIYIYTYIYIYIYNNIYIYIYIHTYIYILGISSSQMTFFCGGG